MIASLVLVLTLAGHGPAGTTHSARPPIGKTETSTPASGEIGTLSPKRELPDYDGRGEDPTSAGEVALWVPRLVFFPVWAVSEFLVRRPLEWLVINAERGQWQKLIMDLFTFGEERQIGVFPSLLIDFGFRPSVGLYTFWNGMLDPKNDVRLHVAYGGSNWYSVKVADRINLDERNRVAVAFGFTRRPDFRFEGIGSRGQEDDFLARYRAEKLNATASFDSILGDAGHFTAFGGARSVNFKVGEPGCCDDQSIEEAVAAGEIAAPPPGYGNDYSVWEHGLSIEWDTRRLRPNPQNGVRLELSASQVFDLGTSLKTPWITYGATIGGAIDLTDRNRVLVLALATDFIEPIHHNGVVPFTEFITVGGPATLPGFKPGTLLGQSRIAGTIEYRWPIWAALDGNVHFGVGNVFGERLEGFRWDLMRMSFGLGIRTTVHRPDHSFSLLVAAGTDTFADGASPTSFRFVLGTTRGF